MTACPDKLLLVHGLADGEVDAVNALMIEQHIAACEGCAAEYARILALRTTIAPARYAAPVSLAGGIEAMLAREESPEPENVVPASPMPGRRSNPVTRHILNRRWASGAVTGLAAGLALMILRPGLPGPSQDPLVEGHIRSLMPGHTLDVMTSDRHVVKPWFTGRIDFAPPVPDLIEDGFPLAGGRLDFVEDRKVAALVYRRRLHVINVFVGRADRPGARATGEASRDGFNIVRWRSGDLDFAAISDLNRKELEQFRDLFIRRAKG